MKAEEIKKKRKELKITQKQLADLLGVSRETIQNYESGSIIPLSRQPILRNFLNGNIGGSIINNSGELANGHIIGGNNINVSLPSEGTQKIIKPDGSMEITATSQNNLDRTTTTQSEIIRLSEKINAMERLVESLHSTIKAKEETIEILKSQLNK